MNVPKSFLLYAGVEVMVSESFSRPILPFIILCFKTRSFLNASVGPLSHPSRYGNLWRRYSSIWQLNCFIFKQDVPMSVAFGDGVTYLIGLAVCS